jgi:hypothetical protein
MSQQSKAIAIVASVIIVLGGLIYAMTLYKPDFNGATIDETKTEDLQAGDSLSIVSSLCSVTVTADGEATGVTAHLYGTAVGLGEEPKLEIVRSGSAVTVRAGRPGLRFFGWNVRMKLDIVVPAGFSGGFSCSSSAGSVSVECDMAVDSFSVSSSAGSVRVRNVRSQGAADVSSSAGSVNAGDIEAASADIHSSAGSVSVGSCRAGTINVHSSAGSISARGLSGTVNASSSAGSVSVTLEEITGDADISSSAGRVTVALPANANANIDASTSAGSVSINNLSIAVETQKKNKVVGRLGDGGPRIVVHSSAGSVELNGQ